MKWKDAVMAVKALSIVEVAARLDIRFGRRKNAYQMCHCFMHEDRDPSMWLKPARNTWRCEACCKGGDIISLVMEHEHLTFAQAVRWLARSFNIEIDEDAERRYLPPKRCRPVRRKAVAKLQPQAVKPTNPLNSSLVVSCACTTSPFCRALVANGILTRTQMLHAASRYHLGGTRDGGVIFWQIDRNYRLLDGKIMFYRTDCHRDHDRHPSWMSTRLKGHNLLPATYEAERCLFGSHLLGASLSADVCVAVVESEKTAIICSELLPTLDSPCPTDVVWLATGGLSNLSVGMLAPLRDFRVIVFPDTDPEGNTYRKWQEITIAAQNELCVHIAVNDILELNATPEQKQRKIDVADFVLEKQV